MARMTTRIRLHAPPPRAHTAAVGWAKSRPNPMGRRNELRLKTQYDTRGKR